ncbi:hypothetical protein GCM10027176_24920 [Actinoallomurus bryophytorum]|uniref:Uncharacterized protein n=1 Tax=Actinoallomurus bryophytorum TaxID=1490222 RepID=A0A543CN38_9ACTN|nr:hypothetical protein [Actinoallomurus bryophytorum]TQL98525.1 hypothetical protein FB559_4151 [Actinoallomurus bryophytorum]
MPNKPELDNGFPALRPALDGLYATFDTSVESEKQRSSCVDVRLPRPPGEVDFDSIMAKVRAFREVGQHKCILPRVLELFAEEVDRSVDYAWNTMNAIGVRWRDWPHDEQAAIQVFMRAWWRSTLSTFPRRLDVLELLSIVGVMRIDVRPYLSYWASRRDVPAVRHLAWLVMDFTVHSAANDRWYEMLDSWIDGIEPRRMLEDSLSVGPDAEVALEFSAARDVLRSWGESS